MKWLGVGMVLWGLVACGSDSSLPGDGALCVTGRSIGCECSDGSMSVRVCESSGAFGSCQCAKLTAGEGESGSGGGEPGAGTGEAGTDGNGESGSGSGDSGAGDGGDSGDGAAGESGSGQAGTGAAGDGPAGDGAAGEAGSGQAGTGAAGDGQAGSGEPPDAGDMYGACLPNGGCNDGLFCASGTTAQGESVSLCTINCEGSGPGSARCEQPESGNVRALCTATVCLLVGCEDAECPTGMQCVQTVGPGSSGRSIFQCVP